MGRLYYFPSILKRANSAWGIIQGPDLIVTMSSIALLDGDCFIKTKVWDIENPRRGGA